MFDYELCVFPMEFDAQRMPRIIEVKRDKELIRLLAMKIEEASEGMHSDSIKIDGYSRDQISYHCRLMADAGYILAKSATSSHTSRFATSVIRLTNEGHDFLDAARNETLWKRAVEMVKSKGVEVTLSTFSQLLKKLAAESLGLPGT